MPREESERRARAELWRFGLEGFGSVYPPQLSGGMRQRTAFLRTILPSKNLMLLDEPFGALDALTRAELQAWLAGLWEQERSSVLLVTHDVEEADLPRRPGHRADPSTRPHRPRIGDFAPAATDARHARLSGVRAGSGYAAQRAWRAGRSRAMSGARQPPRWLAPLLLIAALLIGWQVAVRLTGTPRWLLPAPSDVLVAFINDWRDPGSERAGHALRGAGRVRAWRW